MEELKKLLEEQRKAFEDFKKANDTEITALKSKGHADPLLSTQVEKANGEIARLQKQIDEVQKIAQRPAAGGASDLDGMKAEHRKSFVDGFIRKGREDGLRDLEKKAMSIGSDADGGYAVPQDLDRTIAAVELALAPMRGMCRVIKVSNEAYEKLVNVHGVASGWVGETTARPELGTSQLQSVKPYFGELYANPQITQKALDDLFFDVATWIGDEVGAKFARDENNAFMVGNGTNKPKGILAYTLAATADATRAFGQIEKVVTATQAVFTADELIDVVHALNPGYRRTAVWCMATTTVAAVRKLKDKNDQYLWQPGFGASGSVANGNPPTIAGYAYEECPDCPTIAAGANVAVFGDFKRGYVIADVVGTRILRDPFTNKPYVGFYTTKRLGGAVEDSNALKVLQLKS